MVQPDPHLPRPNSIFVTHLIATVEQAPQTRTLRRATASDARAAYTVGPPRIDRHRAEGAADRLIKIDGGQRRTCAVPAISAVLWYRWARFVCPPCDSIEP